MRRRSPRCSGKGSSRLGRILYGPVRPRRGRIRGKGGLARRGYVGPRMKKKNGPGMWLPVARRTGEARVVATVGPTTTTRVTEATTVVGRAAVVKMSGIF